MQNDLKYWHKCKLTSVRKILQQNVLDNIKFMRFTLLILSVSILLICCTSLNSDSRSQSPVLRSSIYAQYCTGSKYNLVSSADKLTNQQYFNMIKGYFNIDPTSIFKAIVHNDQQAILNELNNKWYALIGYVGPFLIGFFLILTSWTCCICCLACKTKKKVRTKCQLLWPSVLLVIFAGTALVSGIIGLTHIVNLKDTTNTMQCGIGLLYEAVINGDTSINGSKFLGTNVILNSLQSLDLFVQDSVNTAMTTFQTDLTQINNSIASGENHNELLGDGVNLNASFVLVYTSQPTPGSTPPLTSSFGTVLGNPTNSSSISGGVYSILTGLSSQVQTTLSPVNQTLYNEQIAYLAQSSSIISSVSDYNNQINDSQSNVADVFDKINPYFGDFKTASTALFGTILGTSAIIIVVIVAIMCVGNSSVRFGMYISGVIQWVVAVIAFSICFSLSIAIPLMYFGCSITNDALQSPTQVQNLVEQLGLNSNISSVINTCVFGDGNIINTYVNTTDLVDQINNSTANIQSAVSGATVDTQPFTDNINTMESTLSDFVSGEQLDISDDPNTLTWFKNVANGSQYNAVCGGDPNYINDQLLPSLSASTTSLIPCNLALANCSSTIDTCTNGCIDINIMMAAEVDVNSFQNHIEARYAGACGTQIANDFSIMYTNWYQVRVDPVNGIASVLNRFQQPGNSLLDDSSTLVATINSLTNNLTAIADSVIARFNSTIDPTTGIIAESNCLPIGEDILIMKDTICVTLFNTFYNLFIITSLCSFGCLLTLYCIMIAGRRHSSTFSSEEGYRLMEGSQHSVN